MGTIRKIFTKIVTPKINYQPLIEVRVFKDALLFNLYSFQQKYPKLLFAPVLKSNAYGHGLVEVAGILDEANTTLSVPRMHSGHLPQRGRGIMCFALIQFLLYKYCSQVSAFRLNQGTLLVDPPGQ